MYYKYARCKIKTLREEEEAIICLNHITYMKKISKDENAVYFTNNNCLWLIDEEFSKLLEDLMNFSRNTSHSLHA